MSILSEEKISAILKSLGPNMLYEGGLLSFARAIEAAVLEAQSKQKPVGWQRRIRYPDAGVIPEWLQCSTEEANSIDSRFPSFEYRRIYAAPVVQPDMRQLHDNILEVVTKQLHYFDNVEKLKSMVSAEEMADALDGGIDRYLNDYVFRAKTRSLTTRLLQVLTEAEGKK